MFLRMFVLAQLFNELGTYFFFTYSFCQGCNSFFFVLAIAQQKSFAQIFFSLFNISFTISYSFVTSNADLLIMIFFIKLYVYLFQLHVHLVDYVSLCLFPYLSIDSQLRSYGQFFLVRFMIFFPFFQELQIRQICGSTFSRALPASQLLFSMSCCPLYSK